MKKKKNLSHEIFYRTDHISLTLLIYFASAAYEFEANISIDTNFIRNSTFSNLHGFFFFMCPDSNFLPGNEFSLYFPPLHEIAAVDFALLPL